MPYSLNQLKTEWIPSTGIALEDFLLLARHVLKKDRTEFARESDHTLTKTQYDQLTALLERRAQHEPVAYLTGSKEFFGREFLVNRHTLIPRPESECLIEDILSFGKNTQTPDYIFDIGTGSGALAITLHEELKNVSPSMYFAASDISLSALAVAQENAHIHNARITFLQGSLLEPYQNILAGHPQYIYIVANLPYVSRELLEKTAPDVQNFEPTTALLSENKGLAHYIQLFHEMKKHTVLHGVCWIEISPEQSALLRAEIQDLFPSSQIFIGQDLAQRDRFIRFTF